MNIRSRIARLEEALRAYTVGLIGQDGRRHPVKTEDLLDCLLAAMCGEDHPLMDIVRGARTEEGDGRLLRLFQGFDTDAHRQLMASYRGGDGNAVQSPH